MTSYRMRMYKRRLWQQRALLVGIGLGLWSAIAVVIIWAVTL